jgi:hypothetical protein
MSLTFPRRFLRSALGPKLRNNYAVENPETDIGAEAFNAAFAALAGINLMVPRAVFVGVWGGSTFTIAEQEEAWNDDHDQTHPTPARTSAGLYTYTFAATYLDEDGVAQPTILTGACAFAGITAVDDTKIAEAFAWVDPTNALRVKVTTALRVLATGVSTLTDLPFWLGVR